MEAQRPQCAVIGEPIPKTWDDYERGCLMTFGGGYQTATESEAFRHGMQTIFNMLRAEFKPAQECRK